MPRNKRILLGNRAYHITHRCYNREFRLKFAVDRDHYQKRLFEMIQKYSVNVFDYMITSNHVHLLLWSESSDQISESMRFLQGSFAQDYNRRKKCSGAFWSGRYNTTLIQDSTHLCRCLFYIGLNMVRTGVVQHPSEWKWCGYHEHTDIRERYRIIHKESLLSSLKYATGGGADFPEWYINTLNEKIQAGELQREAFWSEAVAVGGRRWIEEISRILPVRKRDIEKIHSNYTHENVPPQMLSEENELYILKGSKRDRSYITRL